MSLGTVTLGNKAGFKPSAPLPVVQITMVGDADYATGGTSGLEAEVQEKIGQAVEILGVVDQTGDATWRLEWNQSTDKLMSFVRATGAEAALHADMHLVTFNLLVLCR